MGGWQPVGCSGAVSDETYHTAGPGATMGPVSGALLPTLRHLPIRRQPLVVTRFSQPQAGRTVTLLLPAPVGRMAGLEGVWHHTCSDSLATAKCSTAHAEPRRIVG